MMEEATKLINALTVLAEEATIYLKKANGKIVAVQMETGMDTGMQMPTAEPWQCPKDGEQCAKCEAQTAPAAQEYVAPEVKKERKPRKAKETKPAVLESIPTPAPAPVFAPVPDAPAKEEVTIKVVDEPVPAKAEEKPTISKPVPDALIIGEDQSFELLCSTIREYVARFSNATPNGHTKARALLDTFKVPRVQELKHEQRMGMIGAMRKEMAAAEPAKEMAAVGART